MEEPLESDLESRNYGFTPIILFFVLIYIISWGWTLTIVYLLPSLYLEQNWNTFKGIMFTLLTGIQSFSPFISALVIISYFQGKQGLKNFFLRFIRVRVSYYWYLLVFFMPIVVYFLPILLNLIIGNPNNHEYFNTDLWNVSWSLLFLNLIYAGLAEEPGWRGYGVPELNKKFPPLLTGIITGVIWAVWHLMLYIYGGRPWYTFPQFFFTVTVISCIYTWIYKKTESLPLTIIFHVMHNIMNTIYINYHKPIWGGLIYLIILIFIIVFDSEFMVGISIRRKNKIGVLHE